ncbi:MAG: Flp family type IVb pilin [Alcanivorax sp.]
MLNLIKSYIQDESGATAIEYGLIVAGIAVAIVVTVGIIGTDLNTTFVTLRSYI